MTTRYHVVALARRVRALVVRHYRGEITVAEAVEAIVGLGLTAADAYRAIERHSLEKGSDHV